MDVIEIDPEQTDLSNREKDGTTFKYENHALERLQEEVRNWLEELGFSKTASFIIFNCMQLGSVNLKELVEISGFSQPAISQRAIQLEDLGIIDRISLPRNKGLTIEFKPIEEIIEGLLKRKFEEPLDRLITSIKEIKAQTNGPATNSEELERLASYLFHLQNIIYSLKKNL